MLPKYELFEVLPNEMSKIDFRIVPAGNPGIEADKTHHLHLLQRRQITNGNSYTHHTCDNRYIYFCGRTTCLSRRHPSQLHVITILYICSSIVKSLSQTPIYTTCLTHQLCILRYILAYRLFFLLPSSWYDVTGHKGLTIHALYYY